MKIRITLSLFLLSYLGLQAQYSGQGAEEGLAVYYADDLDGQATSYGELYRREDFTAGHQYYPSGTLLRVTRVDNGQSVQVRVNDKMAPDPERKIILSRAAAMQIGLIAAGKLRVRIEPAAVGRNRPTDYSSVNPSDNRTPFSGLQQYSVKGGQSSPPANVVQRSASTYPNQPALTTLRSAPNNAVLNSGRALAPGLSGYVIQLASYDDGANAVKYANQLQKQGIQHAYIWEKDGKNRVVIARFQNKASAIDYLNGLRQQYLIDGIVVQLR